MKIISSQDMRLLEERAYNDGLSDSDFMEEAGSGIALFIHDFVELHALNHSIHLLCGKGNNAGDAYVAGIHLLHLDYDVIAYQLFPIDDCSSLCQASYRRFLDEGGRVLRIEKAEDLSLPSGGVLVDGILGTGFSGTVKEPLASVIQLMNRSGLPIISVDIPSGLNGTTGLAQENGTSVVAFETAFLGLPKTGFFLNQGWESVGKLRYVDFGLPRKYIEESTAEMIMLTREDVIPLLPKLKRSRHKYEAGEVIGLAGSPGMPGAALLSTSAALHAGAGIVRLLHPKGMEAQLAPSIPELIKVPYSFDSFPEVLALMNHAAAVFIGPGLGRSEETFRLLSKLLPEILVPCVIDADALAFLATPEGNAITLPDRTLLTPHRGEMQKLLGIDKSQSTITLDYLKQCREYAAKREVTLILKGGPTFILQGNEPIYVCPRGDPGMATAGSGDVLTGLLAGLMAQKRSPLQAALLGTYVHGTAGEYAASELSSYCMTASDILYHFPEGFLLEEY